MHFQEEGFSVQCIREEMRDVAESDEKACQVLADQIFH